MRISKKMIVWAENNGACFAAKEWLRRKPRTTEKLVKRNINWAYWALAEILTWGKYVNFRSELLAAAPFKLEMNKVTLWHLNLALKNKFVRKKK